MGNWASNMCCWSPTSQLQMKWFKFRKKPRDISLKWRKIKLPRSKRFLKGSRIVNKVQHIHLCQYITLILMRRIHNFDPTDLPLLLYMIPHFQCIWKKFIVHLSLKKLCLRGILWFMKKVIPLAIISRNIWCFHFQPW